MSAKNGSGDTKKAGLGKKIYYVTLFVIFAVIGALAAGKVISTRREAEAREKENNALIEKYTLEMEELTAASNSLRGELTETENRYSNELARLKETDKDFYNVLNMYSRNIETVRLLAGLTSVSGSGVIIKLDDSGLGSALVHDTYLNEILNVLKEAGAQAISINGERIVTGSEVICLGPSIRVNGVRLFAPYRISAVGDPDELLKAYQESRIYKTIVTQNLLYDAQKSDNILIGPYTGKVGSTAGN